MSTHVEEVEKALSKVQQNREAISDLASVEDKVLLLSFGLKEEANSSSELSESAEESVTEHEHEGSQPSIRSYNWAV